MYFFMDIVFIDSIILVFISGQSLYLRINLIARI